MNLSISNLAWEHKDLESTLKILQKYKIKKTEGVLSKINKWDLIDDAELKNVKTMLESFDVEMGSIQSIFYGVDINSLNEKNKFIQHINKLIEFSKTLGFNV